jgi:hypothetical protein
VESSRSIARSLVGQLIRHLPAPVLALALVAGGIGAGLYASALAQGNATPVGAVAETGDLCPDELYGPDSEPWVRGELYFGVPSDEDGASGEERFDTFLDTEVTPRFPDGLTLLSGLGQWRSSASDEISQQDSMLLIILYPQDPSGATNALFEEIRDAYETQFDQESVLRADHVGPVCTSF